MQSVEWQACTDATPMLRYLLGTDAPRVQDIASFPDARTSDRKFRLFACACHDRLRGRLPDFLTRSIVDVAIRFAEGRATADDLARADAELTRVLNALEPTWRASRGDERNRLRPIYNILALAFQLTRPEAPKAAWYASSNACYAADELAAQGDGGANRAGEERAQADLLRCIVGDPFRPVSVDPRWLTDNVVALARTIDRDGSFDDLPILADALQDAGCDEGGFLAHCRSAGPHARGCWVVGAFLGKA